jgi:uncharacterized protein (UPF0216 family)
MKTYTTTVDEVGNKRWFLNGELHREDGPAVEYADGYKAWYKHDKLHRENGPAIEYANGDRWWFIDGEFHREDGPAVENADGYKHWYLYDEKLTEEQFNQLTTKNLTPSVKMIEINGIKYELKRVE